MVEKDIDTMGKVCPYPVTVTLKALREMEKGDSIGLLTDDPLAIKAIPEEIRGSGFSCDVERIQKGWRIGIKKL